MGLPVTETRLRELIQDISAEKSRLTKRLARAEALLDRARNDLNIAWSGDAKTVTDLRDEIDAFLHESEKP